MLRNFLSILFNNDKRQKEKKTVKAVNERIKLDMSRNSEAAAVKGKI